MEDLEEFHALTLQPEIIEFLPDWNVPKEQRLDWLINYEIKRTSSFFKRSQRAEISESFVFV